ncbi:MAG: HEAT repeat domain-containing protein [Methylacidiphilales bacterium]|nr:HEAT repeat domain-containing protein [Candidatus Methylacidiphilales bacterium]
MVNSSRLLTLVQEAASETTSHQRLEELARMNVELGRVVAANISATPELLQELSYSDDGEIRKAVTSNPNTPTDVLLPMGAEFPEELLENPVFSLLLLENPNLLLTEIPEETQVSLLKLANIPDAFVQWALTSRRANIMYAVAMNPKTSKLDLQKLIAEASKHWVTSRVPNVAKLHVNWAGEMTAGWDDFVLSILQKRQLFKDCIHEEQFCETSLWQMGVIPDSFLPSLHRNSLAQIARHYDTPAQTIAAIWQNPKTLIKKILIAIAGNINTPVHILEKLAGDRDGWVRRTVFQNPSTPNAIFQIFHEYEVAIANPHTSTAKLSEMATRDWEQTLLGIASHGNTAPELLIQLATAKSWEIRAAVALNPNVPMQVLEELVLDKRLGVRRQIARNPKTPASLLVRLLQDKKTDLRREIAKHPHITSAILELLVRDADYYVRVGVVENAKTPVEVLAYLANDKDAYVRKHVARNPRATEAILLQLASDSDSSVRQCVARNPNVPISVSIKLALDDAIAVRYSIAENFSTPNHILTSLTADKFVRVSLQAGKTLEYKQSFNQSNSQNNFVSQVIDDDYVVASNPQTPIPVLIELVLKDGYEVTQLAAKNLYQQLALNPAIPGNVLEKCAEISKLDIKIALLRHPNVPVSVLHKFTASSSFRLRRLLSQNPNLDVDVSLFEKLLQDKHPEVRRIALENFLRTTKKWENDGLREFCGNGKRYTIQVLQQKN